MCAMLPYGGTSTLNGWIPAMMAVPSNGGPQVGGLVM